MSSSGLLHGQKALITGASRGIGRAIAEYYAREKASLVLTARTVSDLEETARLCKEKGGPEVHIIPADLTSLAECERLIKMVLDTHGPMDIVVNNAGIATRAVVPPTGDDLFASESPIVGSPEGWTKVLTINMDVPMRLTRAFSPYMVQKKAGAIVNIASISGIDPMGRCPAYCASKFGLRGWSKSCHEALRPHGVKSVSICPGLVDTAMTTWVKGDRGMFIQPEDIAEAALFVARMSANAVPEEVVIRTGMPIST